MGDDLGAVFLWLPILCGIVVWSNWDSDNIVGHLRHQVAYGASYSEVHMQARPKDCDFWGAPVGIKDCSYKPLVTAYNAAGEVVPGGKPRYGTDESPENLSSPTTMERAGLGLPQSQITLSNASRFSGGR
jgi:hypothetical protein